MKDSCRHTRCNYTKKTLLHSAAVCKTWMCMYLSQLLWTVIRPYVLVSSIRP